MTEGSQSNFDMNSESKSHWEPWRPVHGIGRMYHFQGLEDKGSQLLISLVEASHDFTPTGNGLRVEFNDFMSYIVSDEGQRSRSLGDAGKVFPCPLFRVSNSYFEQYFEEESGGTHSGSPLFKSVHYVVCTTDKMIDVLTCVLPTVVVLTGMNNLPH